MRGRLGDERGFTLAEVMVVVAIMVVVMAAVYGIFDAAVRLFVLGAQRMEATGTARVALERMEREIRAAYPYDEGAPVADTRLLVVMDATRLTFGNEAGAGDYPDERDYYLVEADGVSGNYRRSVRPILVLRGGEPAETTTAESSDPRVEIGSSRECRDEACL